MMQKAVWFSLCVILLFGAQVWADVHGFTASNTPVVRVQNPSVPGSSFAADEVDTVYYSENFESGVGGWTFVDVTAAGIKWHTDTFNAYQGNSWWCGDPAIGGYDNHWLQYLVSPALNFTGVTNPVLTFKLYYNVETPGGEPPPYDGWDGCNVWASVDGGSTWSVINPTAPAYNCQNLYSFGVEWGMGPGIAGWGGASGGWVDASFNLASLVGQPNVKIRFAFSSDPAYCTIQNPAMIGMFVDNILITAGSTTLLSNNADGIAIPGPMTFDTGGSAGDYWTWTTTSSHSGTHSMQCVTTNHFNLSDALVSPWLDIMPNAFTAFRFWLWCDMPDFDGDGNNTLEDYYHMEVSTDGVVWNEVFYDYGDSTRPGGALVGWDDYLPGDPFNGNINMDLSAYAGDQIKLRWRVITDANNDGGIGTGLYIDDLELFTTGYQHDCAAENMYVPMPTSVYFDTIHCSVDLHNYGLSNEPLVPAFYRINTGTPQPLIPWAVIPSTQTVVKTFNWVTPNPGNYFFDSWTALASDENRANDTSKAGLVELTAANVFEFGYDNRQYSYEPSVYYFNFDPGEGAYIRYTPNDDGVNFNISGQTLKALFHNTGQIRIHIYQQGTATQPGSEVTNFVANVTQVYPAWQTFDISGVGYLQNMQHDFWVFYETITAGTAQIMGWNDIIHGEGHFFANFGSGMGPSNYDFFARAVFQPGTAATVTINLTPINPPIQIPASGGSFNYNITVVNTTTTPQTFDGWVMVRLPNMSYYGPVLGPINNLTLPGGGTITRLRSQTVPASAPAGSYLMEGRVGDYPNTIWDTGTFPFTKLTTGDGMPVTGWESTGESFDDLIAANMPAQFALLGAYPNPFNPTTTLSFALPTAAKVTLNVYDVSGRLVASLLDGWREAGVHEVTFDGSHLASGIYLYHLNSGDQSFTGKMVLMK